jgi:hypothetical protein
MNVSAQLLLVVAIILLAANLVTVFLVSSARPAYAQAGRQCIGVSVTNCYDPKDHCTRQVACRAWSDGTVEFTWADEIKRDWKPWQTLSP